MPFAIDGVLLSNLLSTEYHLVVALVKECDMEELTLDQIPRKTRDLYEKAMAAL